MGRSQVIEYLKSEHFNLKKRFFCTPVQVFWLRLSCGKRKTQIHQNSRATFGDARTN